MRISGKMRIVSGVASVMAGAAFLIGFAWSAQAGSFRKVDKEMEKALEVFGKLDPRSAVTIRGVLIRDRQMKMTVLDIAEMKRRIHFLQSGETPDARERAKRLLPRLQQKLLIYQKRLAREIERFRRPYQRKYDRLKKREALYQEKADALEQKGRKNDSYLKRIDDMQPDIEKYETMLTALKKMEEFTMTAKPESGEKGVETNTHGKTKGKTWAGEKRIPW